MPPPTAEAQDADTAQRNGLRGKVAHAASGAKKMKPERETVVRVAEGVADANGCSCDSLSSGFSSTWEPSYWKKQVLFSILEIGLLVWNLVEESGAQVEGRDPANARQSAVAMMIVALVLGLFVLLWTARFLRQTQGHWAQARSALQRHGISSTVMSHDEAMQVCTQEGARLRRRKLALASQVKLRDVIFPWQEKTKAHARFFALEFAVDWLTFCASLLLFRPGEPLNPVAYIQGVWSCLNVVLMLRSVLMEALALYSSGPLTRCFNLSHMCGCLSLIMAMSLIGFLITAEVAQRDDGAGLAVSGGLTVGLTSAVLGGFLVGFYITTLIQRTCGCLKRRTAGGGDGQTSMMVVRAPVLGTAQQV